MKRILIVLCLSFSFLTQSSALAQENNQTSFADDSIKDITTVVALGAGGAILGLSTLSFVDEPSDHLKNIVVGGAIGIIIGVGVVAMNQANKSRDLYNNAYKGNSEFDTYARKRWHVSSSKKYEIKKPTSLGYTFSF